MGLFVFEEEEKESEQSVQEEILDKTDQTDGYEENLVNHNYIEPKMSSKPNVSTEEISEELIRYICIAIEKWAENYGMQYLPKRILFKKALTLMNAWDRIDIFDK